METIVKDNTNPVERNHHLPSRVALIVAALAMAVCMLLDIVMEVMDDDNLFVLFALCIISLGCMTLSFSVLARWFNFRSDSDAGIDLVLILSSFALSLGAVIGGSIAISGLEECETYVDLIDRALYLAEWVSFWNGMSILCGIAWAIGVFMIARALWRLYKSRAHVGYILLSILAYIASVVESIFVILRFFNGFWSDTDIAGDIDSLNNILLVDPLFIGIGALGAMNLNRTLIPSGEFVAPVVAPTKSLLRYFAIAAVMAVAGLIIGLMFDMSWWGFVIAAIIILFVLVLVLSHTDEDYRTWLKVWRSY